MSVRPTPMLLTTLVLSLVAAAVMSLAGCSGNEAKAASEGAPPAPPVSVAAVVSKKVLELQEFSGRIEAVESAQIRARVPGTIDAVKFRPGALVKKGDVLFVIDPRSYQAEVARLDAAVASARAKAEHAAAEFERSKLLKADNAISQRDFDERASNARQLAANAKADEAALAASRLNLDFSVVRAPISGRIGKAEVTEGNLVDSSVVLTSIVSIDPVYVSFDGDEATFLQVGALARKGGPGMKVQAGLANETGYPHEGKLDFVDNRIDPVSGTVRMRAVLRNADASLVPGLFARVQVGTDGKGEALLINDTAIGTDQNRKYVYVIGADNKAEYRVVTLGPLVDGLRVARSGLKPGERIVVNGLQRVRPGAPISPEVVPMTAAASAPVRQ